MEPPKIEHAIYVTPVEDEPYEEVVTQDMKKLFDDASYVTVELVERTIIEDENGNSNGMHNMVPDCFNAEVIYCYEKWKITKNLYLQVAINYWGEGDANAEI